MIAVQLFSFSFFFPTKTKVVHWAEKVNTMSSFPISTVQSTIWNFLMTKTKAATIASIWAHATELLSTENECRTRNKKVNQWNCRTVRFFKSDKQNFCAISTMDWPHVDSVNQDCWQIIRQRHMSITLNLQIRQNQSNATLATITNDNWKIWRNAMDYKMKVCWAEFKIHFNYSIISLQINSKFQNMWRQKWMRKMIELSNAD